MEYLLTGYLILSIWSMALIWGSWEIGRQVRRIGEERKEVRRWVRLKGLMEKQWRERI